MGFIVGLTDGNREGLRVGATEPPVGEVVGEEVSSINEFILEYTNIPLAVLGML